MPQIIIIRPVGQLISLEDFGPVPDGAGMQKMKVGAALGGSESDSKEVSSARSLHL